MKKNVLFMAIFIAISIFLFSTAAICNQCSISIPDEESISEGDEVSGGGPATDHQDETAAPQTTETSDDDGNGDGNGDGTAGEPSEDNNPPVIESIIMAIPGAPEDFDVFDPEVQEGILQSFPESRESNVYIEASDADGDELSYYAGDNRGNEYEVHRSDNNHAVFGWFSPGDAGPVVLYVLVVDEEGMETRHDININIHDYSADDEGSDEPEGTSVGLSIIRELSGSIVSDGVVYLSSTEPEPSIYFGDTGDNLQAKGYLCFDIRDLHGRTVLDASYSFRDLEPSNDPGFARTVDVKAYYYGGSLDFEDFAVEGRTIDRLDIPFSTVHSNHNEILREEIQRMLDDDSKNYFQMKIGLSDIKDDDGVPDGYFIYLSNVEVTIIYR
jgi:hypothetical protein